MPFLKSGGNQTIWVIKKSWILTLLFSPKPFMVRKFDREHEKSPGGSTVVSAPQTVLQDWGFF